MRALVVSLSAALLLTACSTRRPVPASEASQPSEPQSDFQRSVEAMGALQREAEVILEAEGHDRFRLWKPEGASRQSVVGVDGYLQLISRRSPSGSGLVVLIIPETEIVQGTEKIMDEVILDVRDAAVERGYQRFAVGAHAWGQVAQIYADGLPSREQVAEKKRSWGETTTKIEKEHVKQ
jgi:hypothetical protein